MNAKIGLASIGGFVALLALACAAGSSAPSEDAGTSGAGGGMANGNVAARGSGGVDGTGSAPGAGGANGAGGAAANGSGGANGAGPAADAGGSGATSGSGGTQGSDGGADASNGKADASNGEAPAGFWDTGPIPQAKNVMIFRFLNRTNGKFQDSEVYWSFKSGSISELHSIADQDTYDMPANSAGRLHFYLCAADDPDCAGDPTKSKYFDFIEHTIGPDRYNGNTTRVDAFGIKIAMRLHCADGFDRAVGEDYETFQEDRATTFQKFVDAVPAEFKALSLIHI